MGKKKKIYYYHFEKLGQITTIVTNIIPKHCRLKGTFSFISHNWHAKRNDSIILEHSSLFGVEPRRKAFVKQYGPVISDQGFKAGFRTNW